MKNAIAWFEIPTTQLDRAQAFYEAVLGQPMRRENMGPSEGAVFAYDPDADGAGGALMMGPTAPQVSGSGTLVYLPMQAAGAFNRPISLQPFGQVPCRAVCGVAALADSTGYRPRPAPCC